jgi:hypothetical protein
MRRAPPAEPPGPVLLTRSQDDGAATSLQQAQRGPYVALAVRSQHHGRASSGSSGAGARRQPPYFWALVAVACVALLHTLDVTLGGQVDETGRSGAGDGGSAAVAARLALHARPPNAEGLAGSTGPLVQTVQQQQQQEQQQVAVTTVGVPNTASASASLSPVPSSSSSAAETPSPTGTASAAPAMPSATRSPSRLLRKSPHPTRLVGLGKTQPPPLSVLSEVAGVGAKLLSAMLSGRAPRTGKRVDVILPPTEAKMVRRETSRTPGGCTPIPVGRPPSPKSPI